MEHVFKFCLILCLQAKETRTLSISVKDYEMNSESRAVERYLLLRNFILTSVRKNLSIMKLTSPEAGEVEKLLEEAFPQDTQLFVWLTTENPLLDGQMPSALILCIPHNPGGLLKALQEYIADRA